MQLTQEPPAQNQSFQDPAVLRLGRELHLWVNTVFHGILHYVASVDGYLFFLGRKGTIFLFCWARRFGEDALEGH